MKAIMRIIMTIRTNYSRLEDIFISTIYSPTLISFKSSINELSPFCLIVPFNSTNLKICHKLNVFLSEPSVENTGLS